MDTKEMSYKFFLAEKMTEQAKLERYINECVLISEGTNTFGNIDIIHESFVDKIKAGITKFLQAIANMWHKFLESMNTLLKTDRAYLEKYKDIILKKKPIDADYNLYQYDQGLPLLLKTDIPIINMNSMDQDLSSDEVFIKKYFGSLIQGAKEPYKIGEIAKARFRGNNGQEVTINSSKLNMTDMYNYCYTYKKLEDLIEKDINNIKKVSTDILTKIDNMARQGEIKKESFDLYGNRQYLSAVYETYIHEVERVVKGENDSNNKSTQSTTDNQTSSNTNQNNNQQQGNPVQNQPHQAYNKTEKGDSNQELNTDKTAKELSEKANRYLKICGEVLAAKQSIAEEIYKAYMSIIKAHVRDHVGKKKDKNDDRVKDAGTDYGSDNNGSNNNSDNEQKDENNNDKPSSNQGFVNDLFTKGKNFVSSKLKKKNNNEPEQK